MRRCQALLQEKVLSDNLKKILQKGRLNDKIRGKVFPSKGEMDRMMTRADTNKRFFKTKYILYNEFGQITTMNGYLPHGTVKYYKFTDFMPIKPSENESEEEGAAAEGVKEG
jgi:hypothetical protein